MSLSAVERRELLALAASFDAFASSPDMVQRHAATLRAWVESKGARSEAAPEQLELAPRAPEAPPSCSSAPPEQRADDSSRTCVAPPAAPSSSSPDQIDQQEKKTEQRSRVRPFTDDPLPDDCRAIYGAVVAERGVILPSADYLWGTWVEFLWAKDRFFATRWNMKRAWRQWCEHERPIEKSGAPEPPPSSPQPIARSKVRLAEAPPSSEERLRTSPEERDAISAAIAAGDFLAAKAIRDPPEARAMSA